MEKSLIAKLKRTVNDEYGDTLNVELFKNYVYLEGEPAFKLGQNGEKDPISPNGMTIYYNNKEIVDEWLKTIAKI